MTPRRAGPGESPPRPAAIVGIGVHAGTAWSSLRAVLRPARQGRGAAFIVAAPALDHADLLRLLGGWTGRRAIPAADGLSPAGGRVYLLPPGQDLAMAGGRLSARSRGHTSLSGDEAVGAFLISLAADLRDRAICILLGDMDGRHAASLDQAGRYGSLTIAEGSRSGTGGASASALVLPASEIGELVASEVARMSERPDDAGGGLDRASSLGTAPLATLFVDENLNVRGFTPDAAALFPVTSAHVGLPETDVPLRLVYPELDGDARRVLRTLSGVDRELRTPATGSRHWVRILPHPYRGPHGVVIGLALTFLDTTQTSQVLRALLESEKRFRLMADSVPALLFTADAELAWDYVNPSFCAYTGLSEPASLGDGWRAAVHPEDAAETERRWRQARRSGQPFEDELRLRGAGGDYRWFLAHAVAGRDASGQPVRWFGSLTDIHERRLSALHRDRLLAELQHRVKNILSVVRSVLSQTVENSANLDEFAAHIEGRINALARTQGVLVRTGAGRVDLEEMLRDELAWQGGDERRVQIAGPAVPLGEKAAEALGLALHELATNAVKYGALASPRGRLAVRWQVHAGGEHPRLTLEWHETGVPVTDMAPRHSGFGRELIEHGLPYDLGATTGLEFRPGGIRCVIEVPLRNL